MGTECRLVQKGQFYIYFVHFTKDYYNSHDAKLLSYNTLKEVQVSVFQQQQILQNLSIFKIHFFTFSLKRKSPC